MSRERNKTHKKNRRKKEFEFWNCKAAFIGGITAIMGCINEIVSICTKIPIVIYLMEVMSVLMLFYYALGTKIFFNCLLCCVFFTRENVDKLGRKC